MLAEEAVVSRMSGPLRVTGLLLAGLVTAVACSTPGPSTPAGTAPSDSAPPPGATVTEAAPTPALPTPAPTPEPPCTADWGSTEKTVPDLGPAPVVALRTSGDACADRIEFDVDGAAAGYTVGYVDEVVQDGSGAPVTVSGGARLRVQLHHPAYDSAGRATLPGRVGEPLPSVSGYRSLQSVVFAGSFEGYSTFGVGVRARLPFRVSVVDGAQPRSRIVLEVAHTWP